MRIDHLAIVLALAVLAGCAGRPQPVFEQAPAPSVPTQATGQSHDDVLFHAFSLVGTPYRYGGNSPSTGFDCSGLIHYVYREAAGLTLPRTTSGLSAMASGRQGARNPLQPGDLVLFAMSGRKVDHAGIYVGDGRFLHAPSTGGRVRVDSLHAGHWQRSFKGSRRVLD